MNLNRSIRRLRGEDGFALAGAATMIFILALVAVSVSLLVVIDARSAQRSAAQTELRGDTDAAVSNVIGQLTTRPGSVALAGLTGKWWDSTSTSQRATCPASKDKASCYKATVVSSNAPNGADPTAGTAITLDVDSVSQCGTDAIGAPVDRLGKGGCQSHVTRVVMSRRSFLDYVIHADREALPPEAFTTYAKTLGASPDCTGLYGTRSSACDVAYTSNDNITGPVHSDDVGLLICGTPTFSTVDVVGTRSASPGTGWITDPTCSTTSGVTGTFHTATNGVGALAVADVLTQSCTTGGTGSCYYSDTIKSLAQTSGTALRAGAAIRFDSSGSPTISGTDLTSGSAVSKTTMPDTGVVYIDGDVTVGGTTANSTGKVKGQLTIFAAGKISIDSDLIYDGATATSVPSTNRNLLGLVAVGPIVVNYSPIGSNGTAPNRTIQAAMASVNSSVIVDKWWDPAAKGTGTPTLTIVGSMIARYRGVFGTYSTSGTLLSGYAKKFIADPRFANQFQPPWFVAPSRSAWTIVSTTPR